MDINITLSSCLLLYPKCVQKEQHSPFHIYNLKKDIRRHWQLDRKRLIEYGVNYTTVAILTYADDTIIVSYSKYPNKIRSYATLTY